MKHWRQHRREVEKLKEDQARSPSVTLQWLP